MTRSRNRRDREYGGALLVTMIVLTSVMAGAAVLVSLQISANRSTDLTRSGLTALYCAEAGLVAARPVIAANYDNWSSGLANPTTEPSWLASAFSHDLDDDRVPDFKITIKDNDDDANPNVDADLRIFVQSQCVRYSDTPKTVSELVVYKPAMNCYESQEGGCNARGNANR